MLSTRITRPRAAAATVCLVLLALPLGGCRSTSGSTIGQVPGSLVKLYDEAAPSGVIELEITRDGGIREMEAEVPITSLPVEAVRAAIAEVVAEVDRPNVGIQFDFYHVQIMEGDLARRFEALLDDIVHVQVSGVPERHEPNIGEVNYPYLFSLMDRLGYTGFVGCEYNPMGSTLDGLRWLFD